MYMYVRDFVQLHNIEQLDSWTYNRVMDVIKLLYKTMTDSYIYTLCGYFHVHLVKTYTEPEMFFVPVMNLHSKVVWFRSG